MVDIGLDDFFGVCYCANGDDWISGVQSFRLWRIRVRNIFRVFSRGNSRCTYDSADEEKSGVDDSHTPGAWIARCHHFGKLVGLD